MAKCSQNASMANLTIRNLPDEVHARLKEQAKRNRRSLNQEVIAELAAALPESADDRAAVARERWARANEKIDAMRAKMTGFMTGQEIDEAIREGRR